MMPPGKYRKVIVLSVVGAAVVLVFALGALRSSEPGLIRRLVLDVCAPLDGVLRLPIDAMKGIWDRYVFLVGLEAENRALKAQNAELANLLIRYREGYEEGRRLKKILQLQEEGAHRSVAAQVIGKDQKGVLKTVLVNKGTVHGVAKGCAVLADRGVVGRVIEASWHVSRVLLITDSNSNVDCFLEGPRTQGILQGDRGGVCLMKYVAKTEEIKPGENVLTAGLSGIFPKGYLLGKVSGADRGVGGMFQRIEVLPAVDFSKLEEVLILVPAKGGGR